jgi:aminoglycoside 3-N-acetyltransferase I
MNSLMPARQPALPGHGMLPTATLTASNAAVVDQTTTEEASMSVTTAASMRILGPSHIELMRQMLAVFGEAFEEQETYGKAPPSDAYLEQLLGSELFIAVAALKGDAVVGGLAAYVLQKFEQERIEIYVYDLAVALPHRREGIATALIQELKTIAVARGAHVIFIQADRGDEPAIQLYTKLGRREDVLHFDIECD